MHLVNYHNHTYLCGHAKGTIDDYIKTSISKGIKEIGFSDHAPIPLPYRTGITMDPEQTEFYIDEIEKRRIIYQDKIKIKLGFEVDYPLFETFNKKYFSDNRIDFLIGSCHFMGDWPFDHPDYITEFDKRDINKIYAEYYAIIESLVSSKLFNIVGHFDLIKKFGHRATDDFKLIIEEISKKMASNDICAEINTSGLLKPVNEIYPSDMIIQIFFNNNVPITLGSDSHSIEDIAYMFSTAVEKIKKAGYRKISGFTKRKRYDILL